MLHGRNLHSEKILSESEKIGLHFPCLSCIISALSGPPHNGIPAAFVQFGIALGLGACNTPQVREKSETPKALEKPQFFAPPHLAKSLEHRPLTTCLTTTAKNRISGFSEVWYRAWFGTKRPWVQVPQPGPKGRYAPNGISPFWYPYLWCGA